MSNLSSEDTYRWILVCAWTALIYLTLPMMPGVWAFLGKFAWIPFVMKAGIIGAAAVSVIVLARKKYIRSVTSFFLLFLLTGTYLWGVRVLSIPAERMHFIEYGVLAILVYRALVLNFKNGPAYTGAFIITSLIGWGDEGIQYLLPNRYFQWRDVGLNCASAALGLALVYVLTRDKRPLDIDKHPL